VIVIGSFAVVSHQPTTLWEHYIPTVFIIVVFVIFKSEEYYSTIVLFCQQLYIKFVSEKATLSAGKSALGNEVFARLCAAH